MDIPSKRWNFAFVEFWNRAQTESAVCSTNVMPVIEFAVEEKIKFSSIGRNFSMQSVRSAGNREGEGHSFTLSAQCTCELIRKVVEASLRIKKKKKKKWNTQLPWFICWFICSLLVSSLLAKCLKISFICRDDRPYTANIVSVIYNTSTTIGPLQKRIHILDMQTDPGITVRKICFRNIYCAKGLLREKGR